MAQRGRPSKKKTQVNANFEVEMKLVKMKQLAWLKKILKPL